MTDPQTRLFDQVRLKLAQLPQEKPLSEVFREACELSAEALKIDRVGIWLFDEGKTSLRCVDLYERKQKEHSGGMILNVADFPNYFRSLQIEKAVPAEVAVTDPRTAELAASYMEPLGIGSMLDAGIYIQGELAGVVCHEQYGAPRSFSVQDRDFASSIADLVALRIQGAALNEMKKLFQRQEQRLISGEKSEALAQMAAGVAHDFNNLLTVIDGHVTMLSAVENLPEEVRSHLLPILEASSRGQALVRELIDFARPERAGPPAVNDLTRVLHDFLPIVRSALGSRHRLEFSCETGTALVLINKTQFCRIVLNLSLNARDAMPEAGVVRLRMASVQSSHKAYNGQHYILLEVADTGQGIAPEILKRIGEPYFTTKPGGTGLGLAIVKKNVDRAGGILEIESSVGLGSTFRVLLPRVGSATGDAQELAPLQTT